jgi:hypothetical protein
MIKESLCVLVLLSLGAAAEAHPGVGIVKDNRGNLFYTDLEQVWKIAPDGKKSLAVPNVHTKDQYSRDRRFSTGFVSWMTATPDGVLFLMDGGDRRRVAPDGKVTTVAAKLSERKPASAEASDLNYHMGLWTDYKGSVYVAVGRERLVLKAQDNGATAVVTRSRDGWSPSGGMFDRDGALWLLEYSPTNAVRVRRIARDGSERYF